MASLSLSRTRMFMSSKPIQSLFLAIVLQLSFSLSFQILHPCYAIWGLTAEEHGDPTAI